MNLKSVALFQPKITSEIQFNKYFNDIEMKNKSLKKFKTDSLIQCSLNYVNELTLIFYIVYYENTYTYYGDLNVVITKDSINITLNTIPHALDTTINNTYKINVANFMREDVEMMRKYVNIANMPYFYSLKNIIYQYWKHYNTQNVLINPKKHNSLELSILNLPLEIVLYICSFMYDEDGYLGENFDWTQFIK